jgi:cytochrome oxidase Cu insertion factor (SCO1/SenC/PrrC family)
MIRHALAAALVAAAVLTTGSGTYAEAPDEALWRAVGATRLPAGAEAPPFALRDLAGQVADLKQLRGRLVLVYFWTTW